MGHFEYLFVIGYVVMQLYAPNMYMRIYNIYQTNIFFNYYYHFYNSCLVTDLVPVEIEYQI